LCLRSTLAPQSATDRQCGEKIALPASGGLWVVGVSEKSTLSCVQVALCQTPLQKVHLPSVTAAYSSAG
jgi:hypothetical protein